MGLSDSRDNKLSIYLNFTHMERANIDTDPSTQMGCTQSKIKNEKAVIRCKDQKQFMRHQTTRISGRGFTIGDVEDEGLALPRSNRTTPPPPEAKGIASWEFFPSMENVPGLTLAEVEENVIERLCL
ncbi:hypothetical protein LguiA_023980 [Lonicera macranthoides]